jgi:hypothetical protein
MPSSWNSHRAVPFGCCSEERFITAVLILKDWPGIGNGRLVFCKTQTGRLDRACPGHPDEKSAALQTIGIIGTRRVTTRAGCSVSLSA